MKNVAMLMLIFLASCNSGPYYSYSQIPNNKSRIVLYREQNIWNSAINYWVEFNDVQICNISNKHYLIRDVEPGNVNISSSVFGSVGTSRISIFLKPNQTLFIKMEINEQRSLSGMFGLIGNAIDEGVSSNNGPVYLGEVSKETAEHDLIKMRQDCM